jgi:hypothetical protein
MSWPRYLTPARRVTTFLVSPINYKLESGIKYMGRRDNETKFFCYKESKNLPIKGPFSLTICKRERERKIHNYQKKGRERKIRKD